MPWFGRDHMRGKSTGGPFVDAYEYMEWSQPSEGRRTLLYRRTLHRAVAIDPDTLEWWTADLQPWTCEGHRHLEVALRERLRGHERPDARTHALAVDVLRKKATLNEAARELCEAFKAVKLPDAEARPWRRLSRPNWM